MDSSVGRRQAWDFSEDEMQMEDEWDLAPTAEEPPTEEELDPEAFFLRPTTPVSVAVEADGMLQEVDGAISATLPVVPGSDSDDDVEPTADSPQSSTQGCDRIRLIAPSSVKRLRLLVKTSVPMAICPPPPKPRRELVLPSDHKEEFVTRHFWSKLTGTQQYNYVYEKLRSFYVSKVHETSLKGAECTKFAQLTGYVRQQHGRQAYKAMETKEKRFLTRRWTELCDPPAYIQKQTKDMFQSGDGANRPLRQGRLKTTSAMFTWILPEGFVDMSGVLDKGESSTSLEQVVERLRQSPSAQKAWAQILDHGRMCMQMAGGEDVAICLEVCPETLELQNIVRLHVHALIRSSSQQLAVRHLAKFDLQEVPAHLSTGIRGVDCNRGRAKWSGFLYCCLKDKKGTVLAEATKQPFTGFLVNPQWIMNLVQAGKLDAAIAHDLVVKCV